MCSTNIIQTGIRHRRRLRRRRIVLYCIYSLSIHPTDIEIVISIECEIHSSKLNKLNNFNVHKVYSNKYNFKGNCKDKNSNYKNNQIL